MRGKLVYVSDCNCIPQQFNGDKNRFYAICWLLSAPGSDKNAWVVREPDRARNGRPEEHFVLEYTGFGKQYRTGEIMQVNLEYFTGITWICDYNIANGADRRFNLVPILPHNYDLFENHYGIEFPEMVMFFPVDYIKTVPAKDLQRFRELGLM